MTHSESNRMEGGKRCHQGSGQGIEPRPLVSIITAVFNGVETLETTIRSVVNQTFRNFEFIIVDGGSTDGTIDLLKAAFGTDRLLDQ